MTGQDDGSHDDRDVDERGQVGGLEDWGQYGRGVIDIEIAGLQLLKDALGDGFVLAVDALFACRGRVIVSGMGKSGHVGQKIAATMASTGTPAYFVHPAEASHGDLGMVSSDDVVLAISNSGESRELSDILLFAKKYDLKLIAITKQATSTLGRLADIVLELPDAKEACPIERAPTTSTTATLALGDALAMALMKRRDFNEEDFVNFHPGGKLGAMLLSVSDLLSSEAYQNLPLVSEQTEMDEVVLTMTAGMRGHAGVVDEGGRLVGVISDGDLRRAFSARKINEPALAVMSKQPRTVDGAMRVYEVVELMKTHKISAVFVIDDQGKPVGLLHIQELLRL